MLVCLVDTETNGLSYEDGARVLEVAAALYDTRHAAVVESFSRLINDERVEKNDAEHINGIPVSLTKAFGSAPMDAWMQFVDLGLRAECIVAHRAEFDQGFVDKSIAALCPEPLARTWVCTKSDFNWPNKLRGDSLVQLALGLGLGVASAHRAMTDVDTIARCLTRVAELCRFAAVAQEVDAAFDKYDFLEPLFRRAMRPKVRVVARVSYEDRQIAKDAGFFWDAQRRDWYRMMCREDVGSLPFRAVERP